MFLRVSADEAVAVGHMHLRQGLGVHHFIFADYLVEREYIGGHCVDFIIGERFRLLPRHRSPREIEDRRRIGHVVGDSAFWAAECGVDLPKISIRTCGPLWVNPHRTLFWRVAS